VSTYIKWEDNYYLVDEGTEEVSFTAKTGQVVTNPDLLKEPNAQPIKIDKPQNSVVNTEYTFSFTLEDAIPNSGYLRITFPELVTMSSSTTQSTGSCIQFACNFPERDFDAEEEVPQRIVEILYPEGLAADDIHEVTIGGISNPRSFKPTGKFFFETLDIDKTSPIDIGFNAETAMTIPDPITGASLVKTNYTNGISQDMTATISATSPVIPGDRWVWTVPTEMGAPPTAEELNCEPVLTEGQELDITCEVDGQKISIIINSFSGLANSFSWEMHGLTNARSTKPSTVELLEL
jgi:hypothetical protein